MMVTYHFHIGIFDRGTEQLLDGGRVLYFFNNGHKL